jgi:hypothetical protein
MAKLSRAVSGAGYEVINVPYPSTRAGMPELVDHLRSAVRKHCTDTSRPIHFITHSLGGIIVRSMQAQGGIDRLGRVVMLAPPNGGSEIVDTLRAWAPYRLATGPLGQRLGTAEDDLPRSLGPVNFDVGVIAGDRSLNPLYSLWVEGRDDGKVSLQNARVPGMRDFLVVHSSHTFIMRRKGVIRQALVFLKNGRFEHP